jgi:hypothetical protein
MRAAWISRRSKKPASSLFHPGVFSRGNRLRTIRRQGGPCPPQKGQPRSFNLSQLERRLPLRQGVRAFRKSPSVLGCLKGSSAKTNGGIMKLRKRRPSVPSNVSDPTPPRFWPGDPIVAIDDGTPGRVEFARHDGTCCIVWDKSGKREWVHEDTIAWPASFQPTRRR